MKLLLDSNILVDLLRKKPGCLARISEATHAGHQVMVSVISVAEVYAGMRPHEREGTIAFLGSLETYPVSLSIAQSAGELKNTAARKGRTLELDDMLIAATAMEYGFQIVTDNVKDFKDIGVTLYEA